MTVIIVVSVLLIMAFSFVVFFGAPFVPTRRVWAESALDLAKIKKTDVVVDLGSGSGVVLEIAVNRGAKAIGFELNPILAMFSRLRLARHGKRARVKIGNFWKSDLPISTTIVYVFAVERDEQKLIKYLREQAKKVKAKELKVVSFGLPLDSEKSIASTDGANLYKF